MARRRGNQEGSIFQRGDGRWVAQITYLGSDGKPKLVCRYARTQADARRKLTTLKSKQDSHQLVITGKATVRDWLDVWLESFIKPNRAPRTYCGYYGLLKEHVPDSIGQLPLSKLAPEILQRHFNSVAARGLGRTAELLRAVLRSAFNKAVKLRRMESNPVLGTDAVQYEHRETNTFTAEQGKLFLDAAASDRLAALYITALSMGLRKGEVCGLRPEDLDFENRVLHVRRSLAWIKLPNADAGQWIERPPKRGSIRDLTMPEAVYRALVRHLARRAEEAAAAGERWSDSGYVFVSATGAPLHERNVSAGFYAVCDRAGIPRLRFHDTRHSCGTLLHVEGADPFVIQKILGHSQLSTTRRYTHVPLEVTKTALDGLQSLFDASETKTEPDPATVKTTVKPGVPQIQ